MHLPPTSVFAPLGDGKQSIQYTILIQRLPVYEVPIDSKVIVSGHCEVSVIVNSGTSLSWTPLENLFLSFKKRCSLFRGSITDLSFKRGVLNSGVFF